MPIVYNTVFDKVKDQDGNEYPVLKFDWRLNRGFILTECLFTKHIIARRLSLANLRSGRVQLNLTGKISEENKAYVDELVVSWNKGKVEVRALEIAVTEETKVKEMMGIVNRGIN